MQFLTFVKKKEKIEKRREKRKEKREESIKNLIPINSYLIMRIKS